MEEDHDPEWLALVAVVRSRTDLSAAVGVLSEQHLLDEAAAIRRLMWVAVSHGVGLPAAATLVISGQQGPDT